MLVIEIDGISHDLKGHRDKIRQKELEKLGLKVLRFTESEVLQNLNGVTIALYKWVENFEVNSNIQPSPTPP